MFLKISQIKIPIHRVDVFLFDADIAKGDLGWRVVKNLLPQQRISNFAVPLFSKSPVTFSQYRCQFIKRIAELSTDNKEIEITLEYLLDLVSRVNSLYKSSRIDKKRRILNLVFSNFFLNGSNLSYELKRPFDLFIKRSNRLLNWAWRDSNSHAFALVPKTSVSTIPPHAHI